MPQQRITNVDVFRDRFNNADLQAVARSSIKTLSALENEPAEVQVAAATALFLTLSQRVGVSPSLLYQGVTNMMNTAEGRRHEFRALDSYVEQELHVG